MRAILTRPCLIQAGNCTGKSSLIQESFLYDKEGSAFTSKIFVGPKSENCYIRAIVVDNYRQLLPTYSDDEWIKMINQALKLEGVLVTNVLSAESTLTLAKHFKDLCCFIVSVDYEVMVKRQSERANKGGEIVNEEQLKNWMHNARASEQFKAIVENQPDDLMVSHTELSESEFLGDHFGHIMQDAEVIKEFK